LTLCDDSFGLSASPHAAHVVCAGRDGAAVATRGPRGGVVVAVAAAAAGAPRGGDAENVSPPVPRAARGGCHGAATVEVAAFDGGAAAAAIRGGDAALGAAAAGDGARDADESMLTDFVDKKLRRRVGTPPSAPPPLAGGVAAESGVADVRRCRSRRSSATEGGTGGPTCRTL
jgi:hypothetical protein